MDPQEEVRRLGRGLQRVIRQHHTTARAVSEALGLHAGQLTQVLNGHRPVRVRLVLEVLVHLGARPGRVFDLLYPLGGVSEGLLREKTKSEEEPAGATPWSEIVRQSELQHGGPLSPEAATERLRAILKREIAEAGLTQREVSRRFCRSADALGHALRGDTELTFFHVFAVLAATEQTLGRVFVEVYSVVPTDPVEELHLAGLLDELEAHHRFMADKLLPKQAAESSMGEARAKSGAPKKRPSSGGETKSRRRARAAKRR